MKLELSFHSANHDAKIPCFAVLRADVERVVAGAVDPDGR